MASAGFVRQYFPGSPVDLYIMPCSWVSCLDDISFHNLILKPLHYTNVVWQCKTYFYKITMLSRWIVSPVAPVVFCPFMWVISALEYSTRPRAMFFPSKVWMLTMAPT